MTLAERLADFATRLTFADLPAPVVASVRLRVLDGLGIALAASTHEFAPALRAALDGWQARGDCTVVGAELTAAAPLAALANGTLAHGLDFDDTHAASITHASAVVLPVFRPRTSYDAQFSLPYSVAAALHDGRVGIDTFAAERLTDERLLGMAGRVVHVVDPASRFPEGFPGWIRLHLADGRRLEAREADGRGGPARPLPVDAIVEKFRDNAGRTLPASRVGDIERAALGLEALDDVGALLRLCRA